MIKTIHKGIYYIIPKKSNTKSYYGRYTDTKGKSQKKFLGKNLKIAKQKLDALKKEILNNSDSNIIKYGHDLGTKLNNLTFEIVYQSYIRVEGGRWSHQEFKTKKSRFKNWILPRFGKMNIENIKYSHIQDYINLLDSQNTDDLIKCSRKSQEHIKSSIQSFFTYCLKEELIDRRNPAQYVEIKPFDNHVTLSLTLEEVIKFYQTIINIDTEDLELRKKRLMLILMIHGRRFSEVRQFKWSYINFITNVYSLPSEITKDKKTHKHLMTDFLRKEFLELRVYKDNDLDFIFTNPTNKNKPYSCIYKFHRSVKISAGIPLTFRCQDYRHVVGTLSYQLCHESLENIRDVLDHGSVKTTEIYSDKDSKNSKKVIDNLFALFGF